METLCKVVGGLVLAMVLVLLFALFVAFFVQWLWNNCLIGAVDGIHRIGFWQAYGLAVLCGFLFKTSGTTSSK